MSRVAVPFSISGLMFLYWPVRPVQMCTCPVKMQNG